MSKHRRAERRRNPAGRPAESQRNARPAPVLHSRHRARRYRRRRLDVRLKAVLVVGIAIALLAALYALNRPGSSLAYPFEVGDPGPGEFAPAMVLPGTDGATFDLAAYRGEIVLLYFQEGLMCPPCWDQIVEMEQNWALYEALGIDRMVSITSDPLDLSAQRASDLGIATPILADVDLAVSKTYEANLYGMMGTTMNGHSFVLVGEDGVILWRADYGGPPKYTMFVPSTHLTTEMARALATRDDAA